jgi:hypothetical protein
MTLIYRLVSSLPIDREVREVVFLARLKIVFGVEE